MTLALDVLLLSVDQDLRVVRERESTGFAMRAADLIELAIARRIEVQGGWLRWLRVTDPRPTGEPLLDATLGYLAAARKRLSPVDWICDQIGGSAVDPGLALLEGQGAVQLYTRQVTRRLAQPEPVLLDPARQQQVKARLDRYLAAGSTAEVLDWALAGLVFECDLWVPGHFDRAAWRQYKEAARGDRGKQTADPVEATVRTLLNESHYARNRDPS